MARGFINFGFIISFATLVLLALTACSSRNSESVVNSENPDSQLKSGTTQLPESGGDLEQNVLELKHQFLQLNQQALQTTDAAARAALQSQLDELRLELAGNRQKLLQQLEAAMSPEEIAQREKQRIEQQQFMASLRDLPVEQRRAAILRHRLSQQGLSEEEITTQVEQMKSHMAMVTVNPEVETAVQNDAAAMREFLEPYRDADPETRRQAFIQWKKQQGTSL